MYTINAKSDTAVTSRLYCYPFHKQRCLNAANSFYESKETGEKREP
ncbi:MAG: SOS response-associated peptidase [Candidatus Thiodiazotropha sp. (ex Dulcina madagascariensis)]|nr:SOS response-associated peptidase [Candidatus Thiodiazotropha sp. (ex Dulcina madagascariensis)]